MDSDKLKLIEQLRHKGVVSKKVAIGIDGANGTGKTTLAYCLGCEFQIPIINIDQFINRNQGSYQEQIRYKELKELISFYKGCQRSIIIEGVCLLAIISKLQLQLDLLIYIKKLNKRREWLDAGIFDHSRPIDELQAN